MDDTIYDLGIVGAGMFGSAAAKHASGNADIKICIVGPEEPTPEEKLTREIFSAHYDEGRITRILDSKILCQILSRYSINRYRKLEELSGINFYSPVGLLYITKQNSPSSENLLQAIKISDLPVVDLSDGDLFKKRFPYIKLETDDYPLLDELGAGHISARNMVAAQKKVAKNQGCEIISKVVKEVKPLINGTHEIITEDGEIIKAKKILICAGAFTNMKKFPMPKVLMNIERETVAFLRISINEAQRLSSMPSIIYKGHEIGGYILPPIKYPDGNYYLKIGHSYPKECDYLKTSDEVKAWYLSRGDPKRVESLTKLLIDILPGLSFEEITEMTCVTSHSPSGLPYIDRVSPTVTIAAVANGEGAKFSDEVGRIAMTLSLSGKWDSELPESSFRVQFEN